MYRKLPPESEYRELQINDIITVLVDYRSSMIERRRRRGPQELEPQRGAGRLAGVRRQGHLSRAAEQRAIRASTARCKASIAPKSDMELRDALTFRIAAAVVDIRPNGNLVIEARREIRINEEVWMQSLTGVVRRQSIGPDRTVRSDEVAELRIDKRERGFRQRQLHPRLVHAMVRQVEAVLESG